eukprot:CAMPEP_0197396788 /NCGR_PEP_ID=MMETSP1165-20131217/10318_1 /TAXON_ID=284809 /ORGANISM="Chrysocystis fragilis, Strain CCMP3189" /LENGTH=817 /DNA_ID=CAMNT_0042922655 /DNA_START=483 /DNA_END=2936 /DNA_ORIENTATION=+
MVTDDVSDSTCRAFELLAPPVHCHRISSVKYPHASLLGGRRASNNLRSCTKLHAWSLVDYDRVILIDSDALVLESLDKLFAVPPEDRIYAVSDIYPRVFSSGFVILRPSLAVLSDMIRASRSVPSYNQGDQDFLNLFFAERERRLYAPHPVGSGAVGGDFGQAFIPLDAKYNYPTWLAVTSFGKSQFPKFPVGVGMLHFRGEVKPWRLNGNRKAFDRLYEPRAFFEWWKQADEAAASLGCKARSWRSTCGVEMCFNGTQCRHSACGATVGLYASRRFDHSDEAVTVVLSTFHGSRLSIEGLVRHYTNSSVVARVVVIWHDPSSPPEGQRRRTVNGKPVSIFWQRRDSLNNRFMPFDVSTRAILICDDDIHVSLDELRFAFDVSRQHPNRLVSPFVRPSRLSSDDNVSSLGYLERDRSFARFGAHHYSFALTKFCFAPSWLLFMYSCLLDPSVYAYVDTVNNCEDLAFNVVAAAVGFDSPLMVDIDVTDYGGSSGLSSHREHLRERAACVPDLVRLVYGAEASTTGHMKESSTASSRFGGTRVHYESLQRAPFDEAGAIPHIQRLVLQRDPAVTIPVVEFFSIDAMRNSSKLRSEPSGEPARTKPSLNGEYESVSNSAWPSSSTGISTNILSGRGAGELPYEKNILSRSGSADSRDVVLIKLRRRDLELADMKDEQRGVLLVRLVPTSARAGDTSACPIRMFYLPKFPENWTKLTHRSMVDVANTVVFTQLTSFDSLVLVNLKELDDAYNRGSRATRRRKAANVTFALMLGNSTESQKRASCPYWSSDQSFSRVGRMWHAAHQAPFYFELVKFRHPVT